MENQEWNTILVCNDTLESLFYTVKRQWKQLQEDAILPEPKDTENYKNNVNKVTACMQCVIDYLFNMGKNKLEMHAPWFIHMETQIGVRDYDIDLIHLSSYYSKQ